MCLHQHVIPRVHIVYMGPVFSVVKTTAGTPAFSISIKSWTLHEVQDPQSAEPVKTN